jgi:hypothetical protein
VFVIVKIVFRVIERPCASGLSAHKLLFFIIGQGLTHTYTPSRHCSDDGPALGMLPRLQRAYSRALREQPRIINGLQGGALGGAGDLVAQQFEGAMPFDSSRATRATVIGATWSAFLVPAVYRRLDRAWPGTGMHAVGWKTVSDIVIMGGFGNAASLALRGNTIPEVQAAMPGVLLNELRVWLPYNLLAFRIVPSHIRPTTTALLTFGWTTYISYTAAWHRKQGANAHANAALESPAQEMRSRDTT